ncbi:MAG: hypothetical protein M5U28_02890 [Sandaracinaceae bacterium]|nr:hypothetical protein [Sandaracinaceae bacterium]
MRCAGWAAPRRASGSPSASSHFSNAEQFFVFDADFLANLEALPSDERSVVLRTFPRARRALPSPRSLALHGAALADMRARIAENGYRTSRQIVMDLMSSRVGLSRAGISVVDAHVPRRFDLARRDAGDR